MPSTVILIGPIGTGKSTLGRLLAEKLALPHYPMDDLRWDYYKEIGWDEATQKQVRDQEGMLGVLRYWKPYEAHAVERNLAEHPSGVIDFGAGHFVYEDAALFARVQTALAPYPNVFLILPSPDPDESVRILRERQADRWDGMVDGTDIHSYFTRHPSNADLAKHTVYTVGKTPEETRDEIIALVI